MQIGYPITAGRLNVNVKPKSYRVALIAFSCALSGLLTLVGLVAIALFTLNRLYTSEYALPPLAELNRLLSVNEPTEHEAIYRYCGQYVFKGMTGDELDEVLKPITHEIRVTFREDGESQRKYVISDTSQIYIYAYIEEDTLTSARLSCYQDISYWLLSNSSSDN